MSKNLDYTGYLVSGINSTTFLQGYDPERKVFDKRKTAMANRWCMSTAKLDNAIYQYLVRDGERIIYAKEECAIINGVQTLETGLNDSSWYSHILAKDYGGESLLLIMRYPECRNGIEEVRDEITPRGTWIQLSPPIVKVHQILKMVDVETYNHPTIEGVALVKSFRTEDISDGL